MSYLIARRSMVLIALVLLDAFEAMLLPRRITRHFRFARLFYIYSWTPWAALAQQMRASKRRYLLPELARSLSLPSSRRPLAARILSHDLALPYSFLRFRQVQDKADYLRRSALVQAHHQLHAHGMIRDCAFTARGQKPRFQNQGFQAKALIDINASTMDNIVTFNIYSITSSSSDCPPVLRLAFCGPPSNMVTVSCAIPSHDTEGTRPGRDIEVKCQGPLRPKPSYPYLSYTLGLVPSRLQQ